MKPYKMEDPYDDWFDLDDDDDEYFSGWCNTPGCVEVGSHYRSECATAEDYEAYYLSLEEDDGRISLAYGWFTVLAFLSRCLRRLWPRKCTICGRRWRHHANCLPF